MSHSYPPLMPALARRVVLTCLVPLLLAAGAAGAAQSVRIEQAWANPTVPGQASSGAFMQLTAATTTRLVGASSPAAAVVEVHEMKMDGTTMTMRPVAGGLALPAGQNVALRPGGYHLMMMNLKQPLQKGSSFPMTLVFRDANGSESRQDVTVTVADRINGGAMADPMHMPAAEHLAK